MTQAIDETGNHNPCTLDQISYDNIISDQSGLSRELTYSQSDILLDSSNQHHGVDTIKFPPTHHVITTPYHTDYQVFQDSEFTIDFWFYKNTQNFTTAEDFNSIMSFAQVRDVYPHGTYAWELYTGTTVTVFFASNTTGDISITGPALNLQQWYHICVSRCGDKIYMYIDGIKEGEVSVNSISVTSDMRLIIGGRETTYNIDGNIHALRITKSFFTPDFFIPPDSPPPSCCPPIGSPTDIVVDIDSESSTITDKSQYQHSLTTVGSPTIGTLTGGTEIYFDARSYLKMPPSPHWNLDADGDFTIEVHCRVTNPPAGVSITTIPGYNYLPIFAASPVNDWSSNITALYSNTDNFGPRYKRFKLVCEPETSGPFAGQFRVQYTMSNMDSNMHQFDSQPEKKEIDRLWVTDYMPIDNWYHMALVYDKSELEYKFFVNGRMTKKFPNTAYYNTIDVDHCDMYIGGIKSYAGAGVQTSTSTDKSFFSGYLHNFIMTRDKLYTCDFTPPPL
jgi:hypothetical protein